MLVGITGMWCWCGDWWWCDGDGGYVVEGDGVVQVLVVWCRMMVWWRVVDGDGVVEGGGW